MTAFINWITQALNSWKFWLVVKPWELGVRIRLGKTAKELKPGFHFRVPLLDQMQAVNTRTRILSTPTTTLRNGSRGYATVRSAIVSFRIKDPIEAMMAYSHPEGIVTAQAQAEIAAGASSGECEEALKNLRGIEIDFVRFVEDVDIRTYRFLQSNSYAASFPDEKEKY